ncbi:VanZ family protein [Enterococcus faecalis]|nr:VanZ family protein [Enterococcus faecalis]
MFLFPSKPTIIKKNFPWQARGNLKPRKEDYMKNYLKDSNLYLVIAFVIMAILFFSSSQTYEQQSQVGLLDKLLSSHPFEEQLKNISFQYAGSEVSIQASGYSKFVEFFIRKGAHFGTYFLLGGSWFIGLVPRIKGLFLTAVVSWLAATGYAGLDEFHQMITGGRTPLFQDVMLDAMGALTAIVICLVVHGLKKNKNRRR